MKNFNTIPRLCDNRHRVTKARRAFEPSMKFRLRQVGEDGSALSLRRSRCRLSPVSFSPSPTCKSRDSPSTVDHRRGPGPGPGSGSGFCPISEARSPSPYPPPRHHMRRRKNSFHQLRGPSLGHQSPHPGRFRKSSPHLTRQPALPTQSSIGPRISVSAIYQM